MNLSNKYKKIIREKEGAYQNQANFYCVLICVCKCVRINYSDRKLNAFCTKTARRRNNYERKHDPKTNDRSDRHL